MLIWRNKGGNFVNFFKVTSPEKYDGIMFPFTRGVGFYVESCI